MKGKTKTYLTLILALALLGSLMAGCSSTQEAPASAAPSENAPASAPVANSGEEAPASEFPYDTMKIGLLTSTSGSLATTGVVTAYGAELAVEQINAAGGVNGVQIELITEDSSDSNTTAINAYEKLVDQDCLLIIGPPWSTQGSAIAPLVSSYEMPTFLRGVGATCLEEGRPWYFRTAPNGYAEAVGALNYMVFDLGCKRLGFIYTNDEYGSAGYDAFTDVIVNYYAEAYGVEMVAFVTHSTGDSDLTAQLMTMKNAGVDGIIAWETSGQQATIMKQRYQLDMMDIPIIGNGVFSDTTTLELITPEEGENVYVLACGINLLSGENEAMNQFCVDYEEAYGMAADSNSAIYYDNVLLAVEAITKANLTGDIESDHAAVLESINSIQGFEGITNTYSFEESGESCAGMTVQKLVAGEITYICDIEGYIVTE